MNIEVPLPDMGEDAGDEAIVTEWYAEEGDIVDEGEALLEVVSDDVTFDVVAPAGGRLAERLVEEDESVMVGDILALIETTDDVERLVQEEFEDTSI